MERIKKIASLKNVQILIFIVIAYMIGNRRDFKYDEYLILLLGVVTLVKDKVEVKDERLRITDILILINILLFGISYYQAFASNNFILDVRINTIISILVKSFGMFLIVQQIKLKELQYTIPIICIGSLYPIQKILKYGLKTNFKGRIFGFWGSPNYVGFFLGLIVLLALVSILKTKNIWMRLFYGSLSIISFFELLLISKSRNALLAVLVSIIIGLVLHFGINRKGVYSIFGLVTVFVLAIFKYKSRFLDLFSLQKLQRDGRVLVYKKSVELLKETDTPLFGKGFNSFFGRKLITAREKLDGTHNDILELLLNHGVVGFIFYSVMFLTILLLLLKAYKEYKDLYSLVGIVLWVYLIILGLFDNAIGASRVFEVPFLIFGIALGKREKIEEKINEEI